MQTTTQTYNIEIEYSDGTIEQFTRTMPTKPTTHKGKIAQNDRMVKWVDKYVADRSIKLNVECKRHEVMPL